MSLQERTAQIGLWCRSSGEVTLDAYFPKEVKFIRALKAGDVLIEGIDGQPYFIPSIGAGEWLPFQCVRVLSSGTDWEGVARKTTAQNIWWFGGD